MEMYKQMPILNAAAPAPSAAANPVVEEIQAEKEQVEEVVIEQPAPIDSMQQIDVYQEFPEGYPDYSGEFGNYE
jgi:hypothetical protein